MIIFLLIFVFCLLFLLGFFLGFLVGVFLDPDCPSDPFCLKCVRDDNFLYFDDLKNGKTE